jgi:hypothetical protein
MKSHKTDKSEQEPRVFAETMHLGTDESKVEDVVDDFKKSESKANEPKFEENEETWRIVAKYFLHGVGFSAIFAVSVLAWAMGLIVLVSIGSLLGLVIGIILLILLVGLVNGAVAAKLWFPVKSGFWDILEHGIVLFLVLLFVNGVLLIPRLVFPNTVIAVILFIIQAFMDGFVGKAVAEFWEEEEPAEVPEAEWKDRNL